MFSQWQEPHREIREIGVRKGGTQGRTRRVRRGKKTQGEHWGYKPRGRVVVKVKRDRQSKGSGWIVKEGREGWSFELWRKGQNFFKDERESVTGEDAVWISNYKPSLPRAQWDQKRLDGFRWMVSLPNQAEHVIFWPSSFYFVLFLALMLCWNFWLLHIKSWRKMVIWFSKRAEKTIKCRANLTKEMSTLRTAITSHAWGVHPLCLSANNNNNYSIFPRAEKNQSYLVHIR